MSRSPSQNNEVRPRYAAAGIAGYGLIFILTLAVLLPLGMSTPEGYHAFYDEGSAVYASHRIAQGDHLYKDLWYFKGPLSYYCLGWIFSIFGESLAVARIAGAALLSILMVLVFACARRLAMLRENPDTWEAPLAGLTAWGLAAMAVVQRVSWHNSWCVSLLCLAAICCAIQAEQTGRRSWTAASGFLAGAAFLTKQVFGLWLILGMVALWAMGKARKNSESGLSPFIWLGGWIAPLAGWIIYSAFAGSLPDFFNLAILYPFKARGVVQGLALAPPALDFSGIGLVFYVLPILLIVLILRSFAAGIHKGRSLALYGVPALCLFGTLFPRADMGHLRPLIPLAAPGIALLMLDVLRKFSGPSKTMLAGAAVLTIFGLLLAGPSLRPAPQSSLDSRMAGGVTADPAIAREINALVLEIQRKTHPGEPIFVAPWAPLVYCLAERPNPTKARIIWPGQWSQPPYIDETVALLDKSGVNIIVWVSGQEKISGRNFEDYAPVMARHIDENFIPVKQIGRFNVLKRAAAHALPPGK
ncbi:ArnT family glycosyltransferase [Desulfatibacillum aliphaticivorans]|uniref:ArnT family glycosyltransferase n=1 Tax=Desulfatibacillum aliphaticivorans TaxID=218208 RepID=UPI000403A8FC|nr:glycosyltransferase family 39 protein [Desulfatibacillum aliphaticivorans]